MAHRTDASIQNFAAMTPETQVYANYYRSRQRGGGDAGLLLPKMYVGARQWGSIKQTGGSENPVRNIVGLVGPAISDGVAALLSKASTNYASGKSIGESAGSAIGPAIKAAFRSLGRRVTGQAGDGAAAVPRRGGRRRARVGRKRKAKTTKRRKARKNGSAGYKRRRTAAARSKTKQRRQVKKATRKPRSPSTANF